MGDRRKEDEIEGVAWDLDAVEALRWQAIRDPPASMQNPRVLMSVPEQDRWKQGHIWKRSNMLASRRCRQVMLHVQETVRMPKEQMCRLSLPL